MSSTELKAELSKIAWADNVNAFTKDTQILSKLYDSNYKIALWAKQFEDADSDNPALPFIREMQLASYHVITLISLALYKPAAASMRTLFEAALFYSYFRTHLSELCTLTKNEKYYLQKSDIIEYHMLHTPNFSDLQKAFDLVVKIDKWYRNVSAIIHGQIPGLWVNQTKLSEIHHIEDLKISSVEYFCEGVDIVHKFFLCTVDREMWHGFSTVSKEAFLKGMPGDKKTILGLDIM